MMKKSIFPIILALAAVNVFAQYTNQSAPFNLVILSSNHTLNGTHLEACHEGAAIEGLYPGISQSSNEPSNDQFQFNTSSSSSVKVNKSVGAEGYLTYELISGNIKYSEGMGLLYIPTSNVAVPEFLPFLEEEYTLVAFDSKNILNIQGYVDDTKLSQENGEPKAYYRWYICETELDYTLTTLSWVMGDHSPENPSCQKVQVLRVFL